MAMIFLAWLMAAGPVATMAGGWPLADSRTTWQTAPAIEFNFDPPLTLSRRLSEAAGGGVKAGWQSGDVKEGAPVARRMCALAEGGGAEGARAPRATSPATRTPPSLPRLAQDQQALLANPRARKRACPGMAIHMKEGARQGTCGRSLRGRAGATPRRGRWSAAPGSSCARELGHQGRRWETLGDR